MKIRKLMAGLLAATIFITTGTCFVVNATDVVDDGLAWESCNPMDENISESKKTQELESDDSLDDEISKGLIEINIEELSNYCVGYEEIEPDPLSYEETTRLDVSPGTYGMNAIGTGAMELQAQISYTPSDAYKNSVYYTRLTNVVLTGDARTDLVNIALSQEGYHEGNSSSDLGGGNSSGSGNYTEYGAWRKVNGQSWCAIFIGWCAAQASIPKSVINNQGTFATTDDMGVTWHSSTSDYKPQVGDLFIWDTRGYHESGKGEHIGIIYKVDSSKIYTIEGNSSNQVKKNSYSLSNSNIAGYGSYDGTSVIYPGKTTVTVSVVGSSVTVNWNAVVNATSYDVYLVQSPWGWNNTDLKYRREGLTTTSYTFTGVEDGYYAAFVVTRPNDNSVQSDWVYFTVVPNTTLTYNANGGNGTMNAITLTFNQPFTSKSCAFTRTGYTFEGWNLKRDADNKWFVYGIGWETEAEMANNGHTKQVYNDPFNLTYDGSFLNGYSGNSTFTVYAVWRPQTYTISYNPNGGTGNMNSVTVAFEEQFSLPACTFKKTGYSCIGWNLKRDADNKWFASGVGWETEAEITSNGHTKNNYGDPFGLHEVNWSWLTGCENATSFTIYPIWQANTYTISFNANGGSGAPGNQTKTHGVDMTLSTTKPTRTGYTFLGWAESASATSAAYQPGGKYTRNEAKTLYAVWKANTLSVVYNSNGATLIKSQGNVIDEATLATIPQIINYTDSYPDGLWNGNNANALFLEKTGYSFKSTSWNTKADGTGISLDWNMGFDSGKDLGNALGVDFSSGNKTVTLYAVWVPITTTLYYNANGGDGTMGTTRLVYDEEYTAAKNTFTREGYTFVGWNLRRDADNKWRVYNKGWFTEAELSSNGYSKTVYEDQYSYTFNHYYFEGYEGNSTYTYFAVWEKNNVIPIEVTLNINCAELKVGETFQLEATVSPENATNKSVTWSTSDNKVAVVDKNGLVTAYNAGTATITAKTVDGGKAATCQVSITYTESEITGPVKTVSLNGHTYSLYNGKVAWTTAKSWCEDHGGHLMTITSAEEQNIVSQLNQDELLLFLGGYLDENNDWNWVTGETFQYTDWSRVTEGSSYLGIQPDSSFNGTEYYIGTYPIQWSDYRLFVPAVSGFIMETEPVPDMKAAVIRSATASFEGKIDLNFYLLFSDDVPADEGAYVLFTGGETNRKLLVSDAPVVVKNGETRYLFNYPVVAKEIRDIINLRVYDGNDQIIKLTNLNESNDYTQTGVDYSLFTYCSKMLASDSSSDEMKALAAATIDYGTAAQIYFEYGDYTLQSVSDEVTAILLSDLEQYKAVFTGSLPSGVNKRALSVLLESDNSLRLSFYYDEGIDPSDYSYTIDGQDVEIIDDSGRHYLEISNVFSNHLGNTHILTISDGTDTYTIECSVLTYARSSVSNGDEARQNLGKALYLYYIMAYRLFK